jgi:hypothetical protein
MQRWFGVGWSIIYITGREGFQDDVLPKLRGNYMSGNSEADNLMMVWIPDADKLRSLKWAVGSKTILKYRLHFFNSHKLYPRKPCKRASVFSTIEGAMENPMVVW